MRNSIHSPQEKKGCWIHCSTFDQLVFIEDITNENEVYVNPDYVEINSQGTEPPQTNATVSKTIETIPDVIPLIPTNVVPLPPVASLTKETKRPETAITLPSSRSSSTTSGRPSEAALSSRPATPKQNGPKKGDKIVTTRPFESSDKPSIEIKQENIMEVKETKNGHLLVDCKDWEKMHWIHQKDVKYLRRFRPSRPRPKSAADRARAAPSRRTRVVPRSVEYILNRAAVMRSGPEFSSRVILDLPAEATVKVNMNKYSKVQTIVHNGMLKKRILVKTKNKRGNLRMGWITMSTERGPMCRRKR